MTRSAGRWHPLLTMLKRVPEHVTSFVSGHSETLTSIVLLMFAGIVFLPDRGASLSIVLENLLTALALVLLFLLQRSQTKSMLPLHMKLNELLRALEEPDNHLINIERLTKTSCGSFMRDMRSYKRLNQRRQRSAFGCLGPISNLVEIQC